jgi:hypothetical protein
LGKNQSIGELMLNLRIDANFEYKSIANITFLDGIVPDFSNPLNAHEFIRKTESGLQCPTSYDHLKMHRTETEEMKKAQDFWLNYAAYQMNPEMQEAIRSEVPEQCNALKDLLWRWHARVLQEEILCVHYHIPANAFTSAYSDQSYLLPTDPSMNLAGRKIDEDVEIPDMFQTRQDYLKLHEKDKQYLSNFNEEYMLESFPNETLEGVEAARKYWFTDISEEEQQSIRESYPVETERLRVLIWKRHLSHEASKVRGDKHLENLILKMKREQNEKIASFIGVASTIAMVAGAVFFCSQPGCRLWL